jgi:UDP-N-acetylmuramate dehydrogenase
VIDSGRPAPARPDAPTPDTPGPDTPDPGALGRLAAALDASLPGAVTRAQRLADLTTYRLGGPIAIVVRVADEAGLGAVAAELARAPVPVLVVGRGSNLLVADRGFAGLGVILGGTFDEVEVDVAAGLVRAGGAVALPVLARRAAAAGLGGLEFLVGIPGSVGGAVRMNAGGHGAETRDVLARAWVLDLAAGSDAAPRSRTAAELDLSYRHSNVTPTEVVVRAELRGDPDTPAACTARVDEIVRWRREHQPGGANAGSVFRNPPGDSAGRLIDAAGCKGLGVGGAVVSEKHANFFQAGPDATAADVRGLVREVQARVAAASGVRLVPELHLVGFESDDEPDPPDGSRRDGPS